MELTRLKRALRMGGGATFEQALALLDTVDLVHEDAERYEGQLRSGSGISEHDMVRFLEENTQELVASLCALQSVGVRGVLQALLSRVDLETFVNEVEAILLREQAWDMIKRFADLDDYPL